MSRLLLSQSNSHLRRAERLRNILQSIDMRTLYTQGCGIFGSLGSGDDMADCYSFKKLNLSGNFDDVIRVKSVAAGWGHSAVVTVDGQLVIFGRPYDDKMIKTINRVNTISSTIGRFYAKFSSDYGGSDEISYGSPQFVDGVEDVLSVRCSLGLTVSLTEGGGVYSMGQNKWGQCGIVSICGLEVCTWGRGLDGQLGVGYIKATPDPMVVRGFKGIVVGVSAGFNHSAAVTDEGLVYVWGKGMASVLKRSASQDSSARVFENQPVPREVKMPQGRRAVEVCSGNNTVVIRCSDGSLWALGGGEVDRSAVCVPLRVQQGIPDNTITRLDGFYNINTSNPSRFINDNDKKKITPIDPTNDILNSQLDTDYLLDIMDLTHRNEKKKEGDKNIENARKESDEIDENRNDNRSENRSGSRSESRSESRNETSREKRGGSSYYEHNIDCLSLPPVALPPDAVLRKGYQRAAVLCSSPIGLIIKNSENNGSGSDSEEHEEHENVLGSGSAPKSNLNNHTGDSNNKEKKVGNSLQVAVYEVIIHGGEAFLKQKQIEIEHIKGKNEADKSPRILDYSTGWQHSLIVLE